MAYPDYRRALEDAAIDINAILDRFFHSGESAVFAGAAPETEAELKNQVAIAFFQAFHIRIHPFQLIVTGSAHLGFSPVPDKLGKPFNSEESDIDFCIISPELFEAWWTELQSSGLDRPTRDLVSRDLFYGFINPANLQGVSNFANRWWVTFGALRTDRAKGIRGRLFKNFWSMQSYNRLSIIWGRDKLLHAEEVADAGIRHEP
jgi:hypothetical protein